MTSIWDMSLPGCVPPALAAATVWCPGDLAVTATPDGGWQVEVRCAAPVLDVTLQATDPMVLAKLLNGLADAFRYAEALCICGELRAGHNIERKRLPCSRLGCDCPAWTPKYPPREGGG